MQIDSIVQACVEQLQRAGSRKSKSLLQCTEKYELTIAAGALQLLRTTSDLTLELTAMRENQKGTLTINSLEPTALAEAIPAVVELAKAAPPDAAHDIAGYQAPKNVTVGPGEPDRATMLARLTEFAEYVQTVYPSARVSAAQLDFTLTRRALANSQGVNVASQQGGYHFHVNLTTNTLPQPCALTTAFATATLERPLQSYGMLETVLQQTSLSTPPRPLPHKLVGDVILSPASVAPFLTMLADNLGDDALISGRSIFRDRLEQAVAAKLLTLHANPAAAEMSDGYFFTSDGYETQNAAIIKQGVLQTFLLSLYGARKTKHARAANLGGAYVLEAGPTALADMIRFIRRGVLVHHFSGGQLAPNGDFAGVASNSYYIADGEIQYPLGDTLMTGNLALMLQNIAHIACEQIDFGDARLPALHVQECTLI